MIVFHRVQRALVSGLMLVTAVAGTAAGTAAQGSPQPDFEPDYFESMLTGYEIEISGDDFVIDEVYQQNYVDGENELVYISSESSVVEISLFDDEDSPEETIGMWIDLFAEEMDDVEVVDSGVDGDVSWSYVIATLDGDEFAYYLQAEAGVSDDIYLLESIVTVEGNLVDAVDEAQQAITIDGDPFMDDVELDDLQELVDGGTFRDSGSPTADDSDNADDDTGRDRDTEEDRKRSRDRDDTDGEEDAGDESETQRDRSRDRDPSSHDDEDDDGN